MIVNANREFRKKLSGIGKDLLDSYMVKTYGKCAVTYVYMNGEVSNV